MIAVTVAFGSYISYAAITQFNQAGNAAGNAAANQQQASSELLSFVYTSVVQGSGGCSTSYQGVTEGTSLTLAFYNYGTTPFNTGVTYINGTAYSGIGVSQIPAGTYISWTLTMGSCVHSTGQSIVLTDPTTGAEVTVQT